MGAMKNILIEIDELRRRVADQQIQLSSLRRQVAELTAEKADLQGKLAQTAGAVSHLTELHTLSTGDVPTSEDRERLIEAGETLWLDSLAQTQR